MTKRLIALLLSVMMVVTLLPAGIFAADTADATPDYEHITVRTEGVNQNSQVMTAGTALQVVGGDNPIDTGAVGQAKPTDGIIGATSHPAFNNGRAANAVWMRSAKTWLYGYAVKIEGLSSSAVATVNAKLWNHSGASTGTNEGYSWDVKNIKINIPGDGTYFLLINGAVNSTRLNRTAIAYVNSYTLSLDADATVTFLGEAEAAIADLGNVEYPGSGNGTAPDASLYTNTLSVQYVDGDGATQSVDYPITEGFAPRVTTTFNAVPVVDSDILGLLPTLPKKISEDGKTASIHEGWAKTEGALKAEEITVLDRHGLLTTPLYPVWKNFPNMEEPALGDYYFDLKAAPVRIPTVAEGLEANHGVTLWEGDTVNFGETGTGIVTFVIKATGIKTPVSLARFLPVGYTMTGSINSWAVNNTWGGGNVGLDGEGKEHPFALNIPKDGTYVISLGRKVFGMDGGGNVLTIPKLKVADINDAYKGVYPLVNDNENAQISLLSISAGNPTVTANFYNEDGTLIGAATQEYPKAAEASDSSTAKKTTCKTVDDMFALTGKELPTKVDPNGEYTYVLKWVDGDGNPVDAVYKNMNVFATFEPVAANQAVVTFVDANGTQIQSGLFNKGTNPPECAAPAKNATEDLTYTFVGWSVDGENVVDMTTYVIGEDVTFKPVFVEDKILKAEVVLPAEGVKMGETVDATVKLNRADLTTGISLSDGTSGVASNVTEPITSGEVVLKYNASLLSAEGGNGTVTVSFTKVEADGTTDATVTFTAAADAAGQANVAVQSGKVSTASVTDYAVVGLNTNITVTGQQTGAYFNGEPVPFNKNKEDGSKPDRQVLWNGNVATGGSDGITFVYKLEGVESPINASNMNIVLNGGVHAWNSWNWQTGGNNGGMKGAEQIFESDGYFYMYVNKVPNGDHAYNTVNELIVFQNPNDVAGPNRDNPNANATFQMLAVVANNLTPTLNFYNEDGTPITTSTHAYTNYSGAMWNKNARTIGNLITIGEAIETAAVPTPVKASDDTNTYTFDGWVDAAGNAIDTSAAFYMSTDVYAHFAATPKTTKYTVTFKNGEEVFATQDVWENERPILPDTEPTKADDATGTFTFAGWSSNGTDIIDPTTVVITEDTEFVAVYTHTDVEFTVTYMDGDKEFYKETVVRSKDAAYTGTPTRATDAYVDDATPAFYHNFEKWVDAEGADANLTNIQGDMTVYSQFVDVPVETWYTVNWIDKDGKVLDTKKVAAGDGVSTGAKGAFDGKADENNWFKFTGWDKATTEITADTDVNATYSETPVNTSSVLTAYTATGKVVDKLVVVGGANGTYTWDTNDLHDFSLGVKIEGASADNPVTVGGMRSAIGGIDSNNSGNYGADAVLFKDVTEDGYYYANVGGAVLTWVNSTVTNSIAISDPDAKRGGKSSDASGNATMTATFIPHFFTPEVRFYGKNGEWLATNKIAPSSSHWSYDRKKVPTLESLYNGEALGAGFLYWADAEGNEVTQLYDSMDVHAVYADVIYGDVNGDGEVTAEDVTALSRYVAGWGAGYDVADAEAADVDGDGELTAADVTAISRYVAGWGAGYELGPKA